MIHIICGEKNQGKTQRIESLYLEAEEGDGFITKKIFTDSVFCGYKLKRLSTGESFDQSLRTELFPSGVAPLYTCGAFSFFEDGFHFADKVIDDIIYKQISPVYIDEIGPLELEKKGHYSCFKKILNTETDVYCTVRNRCIYDVISFFNIENYSLIRI